jgi:hypothetical protein
MNLRWIRTIDAPGAQNCHRPIRGIVKPGTSKATSRPYAPGVGLGNAWPLDLSPKIRRSIYLKSPAV